MKNTAQLDSLIKQTQKELLDARIKLDALYFKRDAICDAPLNRNYIEDGIL